VTSAAYYGPRRDFDPVTLACKGLLVEEQRTNSLLQSAAFDTASWTKEELNTSGTPAWVNVAIAPDGTQTASKLLTTTANANHRIYQSTSLTIGVVSTLSVYAKAAEYRYVGLLNSFPDGVAVFDLQTGVVSSTGANVTATTITPVGNSWYRCTMTSATTAYQVKQIAVFNNGTQSGDVFTGVATSGLYIWGAQLEAGSFATSYIPTGAATATRNADVASVSTQAFPYSATESTLVASVSALAVYTGGILRLGPSAGNNGLRLYQNNSTFRAYVDTGSFVSIGTATPNTVQKMALAYNGVSNGAVLDGGTVSSVGTTVAAVAEKLEIGGLSNSSDYFCGHIRQVTYIPRRVTNTELQTRTA
jgi:hypothetical protein